MVKVAVLISGNGTNLQALIDACAEEDFPAEIVKVFSNREKAYGLERAKKAGIDTMVIKHTDFESREAFDEKLNTEIRACGAKFICLAGFMRILDARFVNRWKNRILNIHPSLLPSFKGLHTQERALEAGVRFTGCTVHFVSPEMDEGPIISQAVLAINPDETADQLSKRVLELEHVIYPHALKMVASGQVRVVGKHVRIDKAAYSNEKIVNPIAD